MIYLYSRFLWDFNTKRCKQIIDKIKLLKKIPIGFHAHNNLELALSNSIEAIDNKIDYLDSTFTGMGRGAGNLNRVITYIFKFKKNYLKLKISKYWTCN